MAVPCIQTGNLAVTNSFEAAGGSAFHNHLFHRFTGFPGALLNAAQEFLLLASNELKIIIRELRPLLFQLALGDVPVAFDFECVHGLKLRPGLPFTMGSNPTVDCRIRKRGTPSAQS